MNIVERYVVSMDRRQYTVYITVEGTSVKVIESICNKV